MDVVEGFKKATQLQQWLELAPKPVELQEEKRWHVFLSYRSVDRNWALHLYDALRLAGFEVFLDQLEIAAGDSLAHRLNNALYSSQSGVLVWSTRYEDSSWCQAEYESMEALCKNKTASFRFVVAKISDVELPPFVRKNVYLDFSEYPDGPQGGELLKLMYGLLGKPLPPNVLQAAQTIDEETKLSLARIRAAKEIRNIKALVQDACAENNAWQASPLLYSAVAEALIELDELDRALDVLKTAQFSFEKAIRPVQLKALALARKGRHAALRANDSTLGEAERSRELKAAEEFLGNAQQMLAELFNLDHRDPEMLGIYARTWMDRYLLTGQRVFLEKSRDLYRLAFDLSDNDYYTGINAAAKSVLLGEHELGAKLALKVELLVGSKAIPGNYWKSATIAEAQLIQGNFERAANIYRKALIDSPLSVGSHGSTYRQAELLLNALNVPADACRKVLVSFAP